MKIIKTIGFIILAVIVIILLLGLVAPKNYSVERSIMIDAPVDIVFDQVKYWRNWSTWSPWAERDSLMVVTVSGADGTVGSKYTWEGNPNITGSGEMTNTGIVEDEILNFHLHFILPWESQSDGYLKVQNVDGKTQAVWAFFGEMQYPMNVFLLFQNMEKMMAPDFDRGLLLLKDVTETNARKILSYKVEEVNLPARHYIGIQKEIAVDDISTFLAESYAILYGQAVASNAGIAGPPSALYYDWDITTGKKIISAAIPVQMPQRVKNAELFNTEAGTFLTVDYLGDYREMEPAYKALDLYMTTKHLLPSVPVIEEYVTDPGQEPDPSKWLTKIYFPVR